MKRILSIAVAVILVAALLCACGSKTVTTKVSAQYVDGFANGYASDVKVDADGNTTYEFTPEKYDEYIDAYSRQVRDEFVGDIETPGQYCYIDSETGGVVVGINPDAYDEASCRAEAEKIGQKAVKFDMNTKDSDGKISVTYRNANTSVDYFTIEVSAE